MDKHHTEISKFLSLVLRHQPDLIGIRLGPQGWVPIDELLEASERHGRRIKRHELEYVVSHNTKNRFSISEDGLHVRASHGHTVEVDLGYEPVAPPDALYHGTAEGALETIRRDGLASGKRHYVHLLEDPVAAELVGRRHGRPVVLRVRAGEMHRSGFLFYRADNDVWLTEQVPPQYIEET